MEVALVLVLLVVLGLMQRERLSRTPQKVSVILQNAEDASYASLKYGLRMAAQDKNVSLTIVNTKGDMTAEEQLGLIEDEIEEGAKAIVVRPVSGVSAARWKKIAQKVPLIFIDDRTKEVAAESSLPVVCTDSDEIGLALAEELKRDYESLLDGKTIGIAYRLQGGSSCVQILESFEENIGGTGAEILWAVDLSNQAGTSNVEAALSDAKAVNIVVCLDDLSLRTAAALSEGNDLHGAIVYGVGSSVESFYCVDAGSVKCMIAPDGFETGYFAVDEIAEELQHWLYSAKSREVPYSVLRRDNLFTEEHQSTLYTMTQ